jgi:hypothetical protein
MVISVSDEFIEIFNYFTLKKEYTAMGHTITPGVKDGIERSHIPLSDVQFLKRGFKITKEGIVVAPLLKRSIEGPFVWTDIRNDQIEVWKNLVFEQLMEASLHDKEYYDQVRAKLRLSTDRSLNEALAALLAMSWEVMYQKFKDRYYGVKGGDF